MSSPSSATTSAINNMVTLFDNNTRWCEDPSSSPTAKSTIKKTTTIFEKLKKKIASFTKTKNKIFPEERHPRKTSSGTSLASESCSYWSGGSMPSTATSHSSSDPWFHWSESRHTLVKDESRKPVKQGSRIIFVKEAAPTQDDIPQEVRNWYDSFQARESLRAKRNQPITQ